MEAGGRFRPTRLANRFEAVKLGRMETTLSSTSSTPETSSLPDREGLLPVTIVTGFLGSGKTTLLRQLIKAPHRLRIGLIINEFGQAGIDAAPASEQTYMELAEGCACCLKNPDLIEAMQELGARRDIDRVILETSGIADPMPLGWTIARPDLAHLVRLDAVLTVVDPINQKRTQTAEWKAQVRNADVVVLSKGDIATPEQMQEAKDAVLALNPDARFVQPGPTLPVEVLLDVEPTRKRGAQQPGEELEAQHSTFNVVTLTGPQFWNLDDLEDLLEELPEEIFRVKGIVPTPDGQWSAFHVVGGRLQIDTRAEKPAHGEGRIAVFGPSLDEARITELFGACREPDDE